MSGDKDSPELKLQGVLLSDNGTVHIPDNPIIKGMICIRCLRYETVNDIYKISIQLYQRVFHIFRPNYG